MNNLKHFVTSCLLWALTYFSTIQPITWASNLFTFGTGLSLLLFLLTLRKTTRAIILKTYRDGKHAPVWFDHLTYWPIILTCAAMGHFWKAGAWFVIYSLDLYNREESKKPVKEDEAK